MGGGLNLRGYAGYYAPEINDEGNYVLSYNGTSGASISAELEFQNIFSLKEFLVYHLKVISSPMLVL